jgi:hypothetical protein
MFYICFDILMVMQLGSMDPRSEPMYSVVFYRELYKPCFTPQLWKKNKYKKTLIIFPNIYTKLTHL